MSEERLKYLLSELAIFISEELCEDDIYEWFLWNFGITKEEFDEIGIDFNYDEEE